MPEPTPDRRAPSLRPRRAPARPGPWLGAALLVVLVAGPLAAGPAADDPLAAARARFEAAVGSLDPAAHRPAVAEGEANAAADYLAGAAALSLSRDEAELLRELILRPPGSWPDGDAARLASVVARESAALELLHRGAAAPECAFPPLPATPGGDLGSFTDLLRASRLLAAAGLLDLEAGREASPALTTLAAFARDLYAQPELLYRLLAVSAETHYLRALHHAVESGAAGSPGTTLTRLRELATGLPDRPSAETFADSLAFLAAEVAERAGETGAADGDGDGDDPETQISLLDALRRMVEASREPGGFRRHLEEATEGPEGAGDVIVALLMPNYTEGLAKLQAVEAARQLARAAVALRIAAAAEGTYPATLPEPAAPDPFAGHPPEYRVLEDGSARLDNPGAAAAWEERYPGRTPPLPFHWHLPAPAGSAD